MNINELKYIPDPDLLFLSKATNEDLDIIFKLLVYDTDKKERFAGQLSNHPLVKQYYPDHSKYINLIIGEIQKFGANSILNVLRFGKGVLYYEILTDVCDKMKIKYKKGDKTNNIEKKLLDHVEKSIRKKYSELSPEEQEKFLEKLNVNDKEKVKKYLLSGAITGSASALSLLFSSFVAVVFSDALGITMVLSGLVLGPLATLGIASYSVATALGPAYRITAPICVIISLLRIKYQNW